MRKPKKYDLVLTRRLLDAYNPFRPLGLGKRPRINSHHPVDWHMPVEERNRAYHLGRIRYFKESLLSGKRVAPLKVDNDWYNLRPVGVCLLDWHHRLCASALAGVEKVRISYSGCVDAMEWLRGDREEPPEWT